MEANTVNAAIGNYQTFVKDIFKAMEGIEKKYGLSFDVGDGKISSLELTLPVKFKLNNEKINRQHFKDMLNCQITLYKDDDAAVITEDERKAVLRRSSRLRLPKQSIKA